MNWLVPHRAFTLPGFLTPAECRVWLARADAIGFEENAPITTARGFVHDPDVRDNARVLADRPAWAAQLWERLQPRFPAYPGFAPVGLNERLRFYRYGPGQKFAPHLDGSFRRPDGSAESAWTVLIYLDGSCEGGATRLLEHDVEVKPETGLLLAFTHRQLHEGAPVTAGRKHVLRTDVMIGLR